MKTWRLWWTVFAAGVMALVAGLLWLSAAVLESERNEWTARIEAERLAATRLSLWRLDAWIGGFLAREAGRPHFEYQPPSRLTGFESDYIRAHFQIDPAGRLSSPQILSPERASALTSLALTLSKDSFTAGSFTTGILATGIFATGNLRIDSSVGDSIEPAGPVARVEPFLPGFGIVDVSVIEHRLKEAQSRLDRRLDSAGWPGFAPELSRRAAAGAQCQLPSEALPSASDPETAQMGPLIPLWLEGIAIDGEPGPEFLFIRRVEWRGQTHYQGFLGRWRVLREALLAEISDLLPRADLRPLNVNSSESAMLATLPVALRLEAPIQAPSGWTVAKTKLAAIWLAAAVAILAVGWTLWASIGFGRRRQRFAAAMAHELRTPLTTFQMYTEMLADGTIKDPQQRREYLDILQQESRRLSGLVENVLVHAGLEEGSMACHQSLCVEDLLEVVTPPLDRHAREAGFRLEVEGGDASATLLTVEVELVERMLFNLVDNACKYASQATTATIHLTARIAKRELILRVRDHGPGIPADLRQEVFKPFSRGSYEVENEPLGSPNGTGLGLALVRDLARSLGGDLELAASVEGGACFDLRLPVLA